MRLATTVTFRVSGAMTIITVTIALLIAIVAFVAAGTVALAFY
jgi:hypothetical protein